MEEDLHTNELPHDHPLFDVSEVKNSSKIYVWGVSTPSAQDRMSEETPHVTIEDLGDVCEAVVGRPILRDHKVGTPLGRIVKAKPNDKNQVEFAFEIEDTVEGHELANEIYAGKLRGVSWGGRHQISKDSKLVHAVTDKKHVELSVTDDPEFEEAKIGGISQRSDLHKEQRKLFCEALRTPEGRAEIGAPVYFGMFEV